jgi:TonB family protein
LQLTSHPVEVRDIWGLYGRQKKSFLMSTGFQAVVIGVIALLGLSNSPMPKQVKDIIRQVYLDALPPDVPKIAPSNKGGGGGGDGSLLNASYGKLAPAAIRKFDPPVVVYNNPNPEITINPTILGTDVANDLRPIPYGDPWGAIGPPSNGRGHDGGIGDNGGGGQGPGEGPGAGPGADGTGGVANPLFVAGRSGLINPVALYRPEPDYSEDARKAKLQGTVLLEVVVDQNGRPQIRKVLQSLGLGLDEQAIKAVSTWRFKAGTMDGKPVPVLINVYVSFRLL